MYSFEINPMISDLEKDEKGYVHWKSWLETYTGIMPEDYLKNVTLERCVKMAHKWPDNTLLIKVDNKTVGFSCVAKSSDGDDIYELVAIYLLKEYQGKKLGYELLKKTLSGINGGNKIVLWVLKGNERAIRFYERFGFRFNGKEKQLPFGVELQMELN